MRFKPWPRIEPYIETPRKRAAVLVSQRRVREKHPLLAPLIAEQQPHPDAVLAERAESWPRWQQDRRDQRARDWRRARARLSTFEPLLRKRLRELWDTAPYPADPVYLLDFLHSVQVGRVDPATLKWRMTPEEAEAARTRLAASMQRQRPRAFHSPAQPNPSEPRRFGRVTTHGILTSGDHD